jgi:hypothetical protein
VAIDKLYIGRYTSHHKPRRGMTMIEEVMRAAPEELAGILSRYHSHLAR